MREKLEMETGKTPLPPEARRLDHQAGPGDFLWIDREALGGHIIDEEFHLAVPDLEAHRDRVALPDLDLGLIVKLALGRSQGPR